MRKLAWENLKDLYMRRDDHYQPFITARFESMVAVIEAAKELPIGCITTQLQKALDYLEEEQDMTSKPPGLILDQEPPNGV